MRCYICDVVIEKPNYNSDHKDYDPCEKCLIIINDLADEYDDVPYIIDETEVDYYPAYYDPANDDFA